MSGNGLEVYCFQGNQGERVPMTVDKLTVNAGTRCLPKFLCYYYERLQEVSLPNGLRTIGEAAFCNCKSLLEISIGNTVQIIGARAFRGCHRIRNVKFQRMPGSSPPQLDSVGEAAFFQCNELSRIEIPSSVTSIGQSAFDSCISLVQMNLSNTGIRTISASAFTFCSSLQTVSLPSTLEQICDYAFHDCSELVTVVVPLDSLPISVETRSFRRCERLVNLVLPQGSNATDDSFEGCVQLQNHYGHRILDGIIGRFDSFPIHEMCYDHATITVQELRQCIGEQERAKGSIADEFGMTPFHIFFSTIERNTQVLDALLDSLPYQIVRWHDVNQKRPLDYLFCNWTDDGTSSLILQMTLQKSMIDPLIRWGAMSWANEMKQKVNEVVSVQEPERRVTLCNEMYSTLDRYENVETTSVLEMALWKWTLKSGWSSDGAKRQVMDRESCRCLCGADIAIPSITSFLLMSEDSIEEDSS